MSQPVHARVRSIDMSPGHKALCGAALCMLSPFETYGGVPQWLKDSVEGVSTYRWEETLCVPKCEDCDALITLRALKEKEKEER